MKQLSLLSLMALLIAVESFELTILHTNDVHSRLDEAYKYGGVCSAQNSADGKCVGGSSRLSTKLKEIRASKPNNLLLDGGDQFQGTFWFFVYKGLAAAQFMKKLGYDAMALGNHEFDEGLPTLQRFINNVTDSSELSIVSSNIDNSNEPGLVGYHPWVIKDVGGRKIGIIGYTTTDTTVLTGPGNTGTLVFNDVVSSVRTAVSEIQANDSSVNIIIAVGHAGFTLDKQIAKEVDGVDIVVGGHTNTFLYTGEDPPASESPEGAYPYVVEKDDADKIGLCVQAYTFTKYLGHLDVTFDDAGEILLYSGNPILLDNSVAKDPEIEAMLEPYRQRVLEEGNKTVSRTAVKLDASCRGQECNFGNLVSDAWIHSNVLFGTGIKWARAAIALVNGGSIRAPIERGDLSYRALLTSLPFGNDIVAVTVSGETLKAAFENSALAKSDVSKSGRFLQHSGAHVTYDMRRPIGDQVVDLQLRCLNCEIPEFEPMDPKANYTILTTSFVASGGDSYDMFVSGRLAFENLGLSEAAMVESYMSTLKTLYPTNENRIRFLTDADDCPAPVDHEVTEAPVGSSPLIYSQSYQVLYCLLAVIFTAVLQL